MPLSDKELLGIGWKPNDKLKGGGVISYLFRMNDGTIMAKVVYGDVDTTMINVSDLIEKDRA